MKVLVTGANGMLGTDLCELLRQSGYETIPTTRKDFDITNETACEDFLNSCDFDILIHCAAYTNVDGAESNKESAFDINAKATSYIAEITAKKNVPLVYISTDYVFDGMKSEPYKPSDEPNPINVYGASKRCGEITAQFNPKHYIVRSSWLYGIHGKNFVETIINLASTQPVLKVVNDQTGCPTWTHDLSNSLINLIKDDSPYGIYHLCGGGYTTWYDFTREIFKLAGLKNEVIPVKTEEFPRPAKRPAFSPMDNNHALRHWKEALKDYMELRKKGGNTT
jgi:dTDP-4-dehydrorhamnose reductase